MITIFKSRQSENRCELCGVQNKFSRVWINVVDPSDEEIKLLISKYKMDSDSVKEMLDMESVPQVSKESNGQTYIILRVPVSEDNEVITIPLGLIFIQPKGVVITVSKKETFAVTKLITKTPRFFSIEKRSVFFRFLIRKILNSYMLELSKIGKKIDDAESSINHALENKEIAVLLSLRKTLVYFRTAMIGNKTVLNKIFSGKIMPLTEEDKEILEDAIIDADEAHQLITIYAEIIANTMSAYASIVSNNLNVVMKFIALVTVALSIPTMIFSLYGMNIELPFQNSLFAMPVVIMAAVVMTATALFYFSKKKWI